MKQRIAVVGADNVFGRKIVKALSATDWAAPRAVDYAFQRSTVASMDRAVVTAEANSWTRALQDCDAVVICLAGAPAGIVSGTRSVIDAVKSNSRSLRVVNISSMTVYGSAEGLVDETRLPEGSLSDYAGARLESERLASAHPHVVTLRPGCEYGPECPQWSERVARWLLQRRIGDLGARGDGYCNLLYVDDLVAAVQRALTLRETDGQVFNLAIPTPPTWNEYFLQFAMALNAVPVRRVTARRLAIETKLLAPPLKIAELVANRLKLPASFFPPAIPPSFLSACRQEIRLDVSRAENILGLQWTRLDEGLRATVDHLRARR
jgi:nucleoside-diphosphate-sugar epimerase